MSTLVEVPSFTQLSSKTAYVNDIPYIGELNPLKQVQTGYAPTKRQKIIASRRKNFQMKKKTEVISNSLNSCL